MVSSYLMGGLICAYAVIALVAAYEGNYPRVLYWVSAASITTSVLWMGVRP